MYKKQKKKTLYGILIGVAVVACLLFMIATWVGGTKWILNGEKAEPTLKDWLVVILSLSLPILLLILSLIVSRRAKKRREAQKAAEE